MNCKNCKIELKDVMKSAEIPHMTNMHYIVCKGCGCVMIATYDGDTIVDAVDTPRNSSISTEAMMQEAAELFKKAGSHVSRQALYLDKEPEKTIPESESHECHCETCTCNKEEQDISLMQRIKQFFKKLFRR